MAADSAHPSPSTQTAQAVLDPGALRELRNGGDDFLREIADLFCSETPAQIARIGRALEAGDLDAVKREAHSLKGASLSMGARGISALSIEIEEQAKQRAVPRAVALVAKLVEEFARVQTALEIELKR